MRRETQDVARKMNTLLRHERPHRRMESVTPRGLHVTCHFRRDQRENLAVDQSQNLSSKPAARGVEIGTHDHTHTHTEAKRNRTRINGEKQDVAQKMNQLLRHERPRRRMKSVTPRGLDVTCHFRLKARRPAASKLEPTTTR